jgi:predicted RNA binding protein YcfA (HicA-like mRNA interferase family)
VRVSERLPRITADDALRALRRAGWRELRQRGSHVHLAHPDRPGRVTVARHRGIILRPKTLKTILEQAGLSIDEFVELL